MKPATIDLISTNSNQVIKGILQINEDGTLQLQINDKPGGSYPKKFETNAPNFYHLRKTEAIPKTENNNAVL